METIPYTEKNEYILQAIGFDFELGPRILVLGQTSVPFGNQTWLAGNLHT